MIKRTKKDRRQIAKDYERMDVTRLLAKWGGSWQRLKRIIVEEGGVIRANGRPRKEQGK